uniref:Uncharacterized protein n=1 Tax=Oryza punctata TaxID=4537 RepID=A0A0E0LH64_ORYPU
MAMRALLSKLRIPAAASRRTLPPFRSSSTAPQGKLSSTATAQDGYPVPGQGRRMIKQMLEEEDRRQRKLMWYEIIGNFIAFNATLYAFYVVRKMD